MATFDSRREREGEGGREREGEGVGEGGAEMTQPMTQGHLRVSDSRTTQRSCPAQASPKTSKGGSPSRSITQKGLDCQWPHHTGFAAGPGYRADSRSRHRLVGIESEPKYLQDRFQSPLGIA
jgi:hypothetical protein